MIQSAAVRPDALGAYGNAVPASVTVTPDPARSRTAYRIAGRFSASVEFEIARIVAPLADNPAAWAVGRTGPALYGDEFVSHVEVVMPKTASTWEELVARVRDEQSAYAIAAE